MRRGRALARDEQGQVLVAVALLLVGVVALVGLTVDGGVVFAQRRDLQGLADAAALAGAMQIDEEAYRAGLGVGLDPEAAYDAAVGYLSGRDVEYVVTADMDQVAVTLARPAETTFLRILGIEAVSISAEGTAEPRYGIAEVGE